MKNSRAITLFHKRMQRSYKNTLKRFKKVVSSYARFKIIFFSVFLSEFFLLLAFFPFFSRSSFFAVVLGLLFLTVFSYFVLLFYFQAKRPEQMYLLKERFIDSCRQLNTAPKGSVEHHLSVAQCALSLVSHLTHFEYRCYSPLFGLSIFSSFCKKLGGYFHREDVFKMKEVLLHSAVKEHLDQIILSPTDLEVHASLANAYVSLSKFYLESGKNKFSRKIETSLKQKFQHAAKRAIEELKILCDYAPNDPWVHAQLAQSYQSLNMCEQEMKEYEKLLELSPEDKTILFRLGVLYFQLGKNAKGLQVYEELKDCRFTNAEKLISYYGAMKPFDAIEEIS